MKYSCYETLLAFCDAIEWAEDPETVFQRIVDVSSEYLECDSAHFHLFDPDGKRFVRYASHDSSPAEQITHMAVTVDLGRISKLLNNKELIIMDDYERPHEQDVIPLHALEEGYKSAISIPIDSSSGVVGMLTIVYKRSLPWDEGDYRFLLDLGRVLGTFVQRIQNSKKEVELAMLRERKQLSSEIHDNLSQVVSAIAVRADIAASCLEEGGDDGLASEIDAIAGQARQVTKMLREEMLSLRMPIEGAGDIVEDLSGIFKRFEDQWGIEIHFDQAEGNHAVISEYARLQLARIVNESLQNVLRHARASSVYVTLRRKNGNVFVAIKDDGVGFDVDAVASERLGIRIMKERAASAGGAIAVESKVGNGTTVTIKMPVVKAP